MSEPISDSRIYEAPRLGDLDAAVLHLIAGQRERLRAYTQGNPRRWSGSLRRSTLARAIQGSNSIEGYEVSLDQAIAAVEDDPPLDERTEAWLAVRGYRDALTYVLQAASDAHFEHSRQVLKAMHFMMVGYDLSKGPGQWRPGSIFVVSNDTGETVYEAPPVEIVDALMQRLVEALRAEDGTPVLVRAAMAHLNLTMIHPFRDGNGRMARALQTLVLARDGLLHPAFSSIEEWLGRNTQAYYDILAATGQSRWNPRHDALPWVRFCLRAHFQQAATLLRRNEEYERIYDAVSVMVAKAGLPDRVSLPLFDAALGFGLTNSRYRKDAEVPEATASRDLRRLVEIGLLAAKGERRGRSYLAGDSLRALRARTRTPQPIADPYEVVTRGNPRLPGM